MKRNAILIAVILFVSGGARSYAQSDTGSRTDQESTYHSGAQIQSDSSVEGGELFDRDPLGQIETPTPLDPPTALEHDPGFVDDDDAGLLDAEGELIVNDEDKEVALEDDDDVMPHEFDLEEHAVGGPGQSTSGSGSSGTIRADSSIRGGSDRARGYDRSGNEYEPPADPLDPSVQADSSIRGGSDRARGAVSDTPSEPGDARTYEHERRYKADSSIRGGSDRARGWDLRKSDSKLSHEHPEYSIESDANSDVDASGSSAVLESGSDISPEADVDLSGTYEDTSSEVDSSDLEIEMDTEIDADNEASGTAPEFESESSTETEPEPYAETLDDAAPESSTTDTDIEIESSTSESDEQSNLERQYHDPDESTLDDADPDASGGSATSESGSESWDENVSDDSSEVDPETGASELGRYSLDGGNESRSTEYDTESHADVATELDKQVPSGRESYDRSDEDLSVTIDNDADITRDGIGSPGSSQSETATSDESDDSDLKAGIQFDSTGDVQAEDPYHPSSRRSEFEASGGLEGVESETESSEQTTPSEAESYQPEFETDASLRSDSHEDSDSIVTDSDLPQSQVGEFPGEPNWRFRSNPAQGVGGPAPFQRETATSADVAGDLAQRVKSQLTKESTGTFGAMKNEMRNIEVIDSGDGKITLKGSVSTQPHKRMIELRAKEVAGVKSVDNQLTVSADAKTLNNQGLGGSSNLEEGRDEFHQSKD